MAFRLLAFLLFSGVGYSVPHYFLSLIFVFQSMEQDLLDVNGIALIWEALHIAEEEDCGVTLQCNLASKSRWCLVVDGQLTLETSAHPSTRPPDSSSPTSDFDVLKDGATSTDTADTIVWSRKRQ